MDKTISASLHPDCYPGSAPEALKYFRDALDGTVSRKRSPHLVGVVAPHIDFRVSLKSHALAFRPLLDEPLPEVYLILGVGHRSQLEWNLDERDYRTPLGRAICAREVVSKLPPFSSPAGHSREHSIEFPLVWLQAIHQLQGSSKPVPIVPLLCGGMHEFVNGVSEWDDLNEFHDLSAALRIVFQDRSLGSSLQVIVSIDGCHLGPRFKHNFAVTPALLRGTDRWEKALWDCVADGNARTFLEWMREEGNHRYFDGVGALALLMNSGAFRIERTYYDQWFTENDRSAVTFSSGTISTL